MRLDQILLWTHLLAVAVWTGGLITLAALVPAMRKAGADRPLLQATARQFGRISWTAMTVAVITGIWQVLDLGIPWRMLEVKLALVASVVALAGIHQVTAKRTSAAVRGAIQGVILVISIAIFGVAVATFT